MTLAIAAALGWLVVATAYRWLAFSSLSKMCGVEKAEGTGSRPPGDAVALRPLRGAGAQLESCLDSLWRAAKGRSLRVLVGIADPRDPAIVVARRVAERWPETEARIAIGEGPQGLNRKVSNLIQAARGEDPEYWILSDADVRVADDYAERILAPFVDRAVGLATCPYVSVPARSVVSRIDALVTNTHFIANACLAARFEGVHFGLGATLALRREALARIGGFESLLPLAADDYWLARKVEEAGFALAWVPMVVEHVLEDEGLRRAFARHVRWARVTRASRPIGYAGSIVTYDLLPALLAAALLGAAGGFGWMPLAGWWALRAAALWRYRDLVRLRARDLWLLPLVDATAIAVFVSGLFGSEEPPRGHVS